jgi:hypothetical protein
VPTWGDARIVGLQIACEGLEENRLAGASDRAEAQVGVEKRLTHHIRAVVRGAWPGGSGVWGGHENGGVFEGKQRVREEIDLVRDASVKGGGDENDMGSIVSKGRG